jgi:tRNA(Ile)-lysidine synthetase-like protein
MKLKKTDSHKNTASKTVESAVSDFLRTSTTLKKGEKLLAAVSGGPDSMALLCALQKAGKDHGHSVVALHLNHMLRGKESLRDENFVRNYCRKNSIPLVVGKKDIKKLAQNNKKGIEETARDERYRFFGKQAEKFSARFVFTAHTKDDQVETVLMRLFRGTGLGGAGGMKKVLQRGRIFIVRPFLSLSKKDILAYNRENEVSFVVDSSNSSTAFARNRFRLKIIPYLKKQLGASFSERISDFSDICRDLDELLSKNIKSVTEKYFVFSAGRLHFPGSVFKELPFYAACEAVRFALEKCFPSASLPEKRVLEINIRKLLGLQSGKTIPLTKELVFLKEREKIFVLRKKELSETRSFRLKIKPGKKTECDFFDLHLVFQMQKESRTKKTDPKKMLEPMRAGEPVSMDVPLSPALAGKHITVRSCRDGDRIAFVSRGRQHTKKVQDLFVDAKVPLFLKKRIPIVTADEKIVSIPGVY